MTKPSESRPAAASVAATVRDGKKPRRKPVSTRVSAVLDHAGRQGLLDDKDQRIAGRVSASLVCRAKARTGIASDTELLSFALASIALDDNFAETFAALRGTVDPALDLEP